MWLSHHIEMEVWKPVLLLKYQMFTRFLEMKENSKKDFPQPLTALSLSPPLFSLLFSYNAMTLSIYVTLTLSNFPPTLFSLSLPPLLRFCTAGHQSPSPLRDSPALSPPLSCGRLANSFVRPGVFSSAFFVHIFKKVYQYFLFCVKYVMS